ncbi:hypothetical protein AB0D46_19970 [Streptomyces sp. NPDC048383]|uniref:hypothetical protein n=1 Tax=Streptomyces sp. NPDC048383 TaxID=3155386 RepID=UPI0034383350
MPTGVDSLATRTRGGDREDHRDGHRKSAARREQQPGRDGPRTPAPAPGGKRTSLGIGAARRSAAYAPSGSSAAAAASSGPAAPDHRATGRGRGQGCPAPRGVVAHLTGEVRSGHRPSGRPEVLQQQSTHRRR